MSYIKNTAGQKVSFLAINTGTGFPMTGDAANITAQISIDFGATSALSDTNPVELDAINFPGQYVFDLTQAETNGDVISISATSTTSGVLIDSVNIYTVDPAEYKADVSTIEAGGAVYNYVEETWEALAEDTQGNLIEPIVNAVWDEPMSNHLTAGSTGSYQNRISAVEDVDSKVDDIIADVGLILTDTSTTIPAQIAALNDLDAADIRSAVGLASANLDTQLGNIPTVSEFEARTLIASAYFDPASDTVANVTTVQTTVNNTDMRGTNNAATASSLVIVDGKCSSILTNTINTESLVNTVDGNVDSVKLKTDQLTFTVPNQVDANALTGGFGDDASTIYNYFTAGTREDAFKANVSGLATQASLNTVDGNVDDIKSTTDQFRFTVPNQVDSNSLTGGTNPSDIYNYFTAGSREDAFKADTSLLATSAELSAVEIKIDGIKSKTDQLVFVDGKVEANVSGGTGGNYAFVGNPIKMVVSEDSVIEMNIVSSGDDVINMDIN